MNSYFQHPFLPSLQGDAQGPVNGLGYQCGPLPGGAGRGYDQSNGQYLCGTGGQPMHGQYGTHSPPGAHPAVSEPMVSRPQDLNGYDNGQTQLGHQGGGWGMPQGAQHSPTDYHQHQAPGATQLGDTTSLPSQGANTGGYSSQANSAPIPFYPWMGVVGKCIHSYL